MVIDFFTRRKLRSKIKEFESILAKEEKPEVRLRLAAFYRKLEQDSEAQKQYIRVAQHFMDQGEYLRAKAVLESTLEYYPDNEAARMMLGELIRDDTPVPDSHSQNKPTSPPSKEPSTASRKTRPVVTYDSTEDMETPTDESSIEDEMDRWGHMTEDDTPLSGYSYPGTTTSSVWFEETSEVDKIEIPSPPKELEGMPSGEEVFGRVLRPTDSLMIEDDLIEDVFEGEEDEFFETLELEEAWNRIPILKTSPAVRQDLWEKSIKVRIPAGKAVFYEGDPGDSLYVLIQGRAVATRLLPNGDEDILMELKPGQIFGEFALISERRRYVTVTAMEPTIVMEIPKGVVQSIAKSHPEFWEFVKYQYRKRLMELVVRTVPIFSSLAEDVLTTYLNELHLKRFAPHTHLFKEGYRGGGFYLIILGRVEIRHSEQRINELGEGFYLADLSLLRKKSVQVSVVAKTTTEAVYLPPKLFYQLLSDYPTIWRKVTETGKRSPLWNKMMVVGKAQDLVII